MTQIHREKDTGIIIGARMFSGVEREGPRKGMQTLFVASPTVTVEEILAQNPKAIYFGAGRLTSINEDVLEYFARSPEYLVTVETGDFSLIQNLLEDPLTTPSVMCILAVSMRTHAGQLWECSLSHPELKDALQKYPTCLGLKTDDEKKVTIVFEHSVYVTQLNSDYAKDVVIR